MNLNPTSNSLETPQNSHLRSSYGMSIVRIWENIDSVITVRHCIIINQWIVVIYYPYYPRLLLECGQYNQTTAKPKSAKFVHNYWDKRCLIVPQKTKLRCLPQTHRYSTWITHNSSHTLILLDTFESLLRDWYLCICMLRYHQCGSTMLQLAKQGIRIIDISYK